MKIDTFDTRGMACPACPRLIDRKLEGMRGVLSAESDWLRCRTTVVFDDAVVSEAAILDAIRLAGFGVTRATRA